MMRLIRRIVVAIIKPLFKAGFTIKLSIYRLLNKQLFVFASSPYWGNVGDHAIFLAQKGLLLKCGLKNRIIDVSSREYTDYKDILKRLLRKTDVIMIDGGGNFGDTWPETMERINDIVETFLDNPIIIFPESWFFSETPAAESLLEHTKTVFSKHPNLILYARDHWSYEQMKRHLSTTTVKSAVDCVLCLDVPVNTVQDMNGVGLCIREDKESVGSLSYSEIYDLLKQKGLKIHSIQNDCYKHISKRERKRYVNWMLAKYQAVDWVLTDRFHGMIFSILCRKPCIVIDNKTGKVRHFAEQLKGQIEGVHIVDSLDQIEKLLNSSLELSVSATFNDAIQRHKAEMLATIKKQII